MKNRKKTRSFTLIELLVSMAVLVVLAMILFNILNRGRQAWSAMETSTRIYENARVVLEVISRDLQCTVNDEDLPFEVDGDGMPAFFSVADRMSNGHARITEIAYQVNDNRFERRMVQDHHSGPAGTGFRRVIEGVEDATFIYYDQEGEILSEGEIYDEPPAVVWVSITLFDPRLVAAPEELRRRSRRTFSKMVYLKTQGF